MNKVSLNQSLQSYTSVFEKEINYKTAFLELLRDDDCFLRSRLAGHLTASCWVLDEPKEHALLMHHNKLNKWLQPGGHADGDDNLLRVATKELKEETGLVHCDVKNEIFDIDIHTIPKKKDIPEHLHYDVRFLFITRQPEEIQKNHESMELRWVNLDKVPDLCGNEESILRMVKKSVKLL